MPNAENGKLDYEAGQTPASYVALTDQGDFKEFKSAVNLWSGRSGYAPSIRPNGLISGCAVTVDSVNNLVNVAAGLAYIAGVKTVIDAVADLEMTRGVTTDTHIVNSITINVSAVSVNVAGVDHTAFDDDVDADAGRGENGGAPWIPTTSIEVAQVRFTTVADAPVAASEIYQVADIYTEWYFSPVCDVVYSDVENMVLGYAGVDFASAVSQRHSDDTGTTTAGKIIYASYKTPSFSEVPDAYDFVPPGNTHSVSSKTVYGRTKGSKSSSLNGGSFSMEMASGITDGILNFTDDLLWFRFYPDRNNDSYILCQGYLGVSQKFPADANIDASCTITAETAAARVNA